MFRPLYHLTVVAVYFYTIWYDQKFMDLPFPAPGYAYMPLRARFAFITFWCLFLQTVYFVLSLLNDFFGSNEVSPQKKPFIRAAKDLVFSLAYPVALFVSLSFWTVYFYNKQLVFPDYIDKLVPFWANIVLHVCNAAFISIEIFVSRVTYPPRRVGLVVALIFNVSYLICIVSLRVSTGAWIYPLFEVLDVPTTVVIFGLSMILGLSLYFLGETLCGFVNSVPVKGPYMKKNH